MGEMRYMVRVINLGSGSPDEKWFSGRWARALWCLENHYGSSRILGWSDPEDDVRADVFDVDEADAELEAGGWIGYLAGKAVQRFTTQKMADDCLARGDVDKIISAVRLSRFAPFEREMLIARIDGEERYTVRSYKYPADFPGRSDGAVWRVWDSKDRRWVETMRATSPTGCGLTDFTLERDAWGTVGYLHEANCGSRAYLAELRDHG